MMTTDSIGLYVHIPFCLKKCRYCDFSSFSSVDAETRTKYLCALVSEIRSYKKKGKNKINTIFFGGGTPSLLSPSELSLLMEAIFESFSLDPDSEISMEINPGTVTRDKLSRFSSLGINRISIGLQSINDNELKLLGRIHNSSDFLDAYRSVRSVGISNVSVDVMYGIPDQTHESFMHTLSSVCDLEPEHISVYGLIIEEGTDFFRRFDTLTLPSEDAECDMYYYAAEKLRFLGYEHYEISNYSKPGFECKHNLKYWHADDYIGVGLAAHSKLSGVRFFNPSTFKEYFALKQGEYILEERLDSESERYEYAMMNLRLSSGFSLSEYQNKFGISFLDGREEAIRNFQKADLMIFSDDRISLTERGFYVSNTILSQLL